MKSDKRLFYTSVFLSLIIAAIGYSIQFILFDNYFNQNTTFFNLSFRFLRMSTGYVLVPWFFFRITKNKMTQFGFELISIRFFVISFVLGILIYLVPSYIFVKYSIFTSQWYFRSWDEIILYLFLIGCMASITDYWTRGFVLLKLEKYYGKIVAIIGQNVLWFVLHIYEIVLIMPFIGLFPSIALTLFLGITGDLITLHYRNISGLMMGHVVLNIFIALAGKGII